MGGFLQEYKRSALKRKKEYLKGECRLLETQLIASQSSSLLIQPLKNQHISSDLNFLTMAVLFHYHQEHCPVLQRSLKRTQRKCDTKKFKEGQRFYYLKDRQHANNTHAGPYWREDRKKKYFNQFVIHLSLGTLWNVRKLYCRAHK